MRSLIPDSLFGRLFVAIVAVVAITLMILLALILRERREFALLESGAGLTVESIAETSEQLAQLPLQAREQALAELRAQRFQKFEQLRRARYSENREAREALERIVVAQLQKKLGHGYEVRAAEPRRLRRDVVPVPVPGEPAARGETPNPGPPMLDRRPFDIEVVLPDGDAVTFRMPSVRAGPVMPRQIFLEFGILTLILGIVLYAMTRTITRPLGKLAKAADTVGRGARIAPLPEAGSRELRAATRAFNAMQERLHRYVDSRTQVLAAISHDLRTPLTRMRLRVESIEDESLRSRCAADLDEMSNMIRGALATFRGLNDEEPPEPVDIGALLGSLQQEFAELGGSVTIEGRAAAPYEGKPLALKRCLGNLLQNAIQYGNEAKVVVEDGAALVIRVRDRGPGIPAEALERVFEPFFRLESSRSRDTGGTGLGLSIARDIAQAHGGSLLLRNLEAGLEAVLSLPRRGR